MRDWHPAALPETFRFVGKNAAGNGRNGCRLAQCIGGRRRQARFPFDIEKATQLIAAANMLLMWVYPLPHQPRPDPVGLAVTSDAVVVFHDGDTLTILPELSAPPTAPGAAKPPSENATP